MPQRAFPVNGIATNLTDDGGWELRSGAGEQLAQDRIVADPIRRQTDIRARRAAARDSLFLSATIRHAGESADGIAPVRVRNLSSVGLMADHNGMCIPGEQVIVTLRGIGSISGKVAWVRTGRIGVAFDSEIDPKLARKPIKIASKPTPKPIRPLF